MVKKKKNGFFPTLPGGGGRAQCSEAARQHQHGLCPQGGEAQQGESHHAQVIPAVFRIRIRIHVFLSLLDPDPSIIKQI